MSSSERAVNKRVLLPDHGVQYVRGVGETRAALLRSVNVHTVEDLLYYFPRRYLDRSTITPISHLRPGMSTTVVGQVESVQLIRGRRPRAVALVGDSTGFLQVVWFNKAEFWAKAFSPGEWVAFSGKVTSYGGVQMVHPEYDRMAEDGTPQAIHTGAIIPLYPSSEALARKGLDSRGFRRILRGALDLCLPALEESLPQEIIARQKLVPLREALEHIHFPRDHGALIRAQRRLKFDELFYLMLMVAQRKKHLAASGPGIAFERVGEKTRQLVERLPFQLTEAQKRVLREIREDMRRPQPMNRLLQGDVGSGKTIVALTSMLIAVENGYQAALMAPTEILAEQHYLTIRDYLRDLGVRVELLIGGQGKSLRQQLVEDVAKGKVDITVGTHALIQEGVQFARLGFVVIDEQHRFGVMQRATLRRKGQAPDVLVMTATPIPRTLSLTVYGDLDVSVLDELPKDRKPIKTYWRTSDKRAAVYQWLRDKVAAGAQAYVVFPLVEESEKMDLRAATEGYEELATGLFAGVPIGLLHGRMRQEDKDQVMSQFKRGELRVLVSTTVIEVGVDVPNATVMVIEHAERFGLPQLHQLRGRVGRGSEQSYCVLLAYPPLSEEARTRLETIATVDDGFRIAEMDLKLRGPGEFFGTKQHGMPEMKIANPVEDVEILLKARDEAFALVERDPQLLREEDHGVRSYYLRHYRGRYGLADIG
ncbi:MAG: ATP-dependent DNA helicase RecG [candidate division KSB1 bacterium]|nr:ATP-dependent DNA helicase RecG [candidate division KSB1 bacterium]